MKKSRLIIHIYLCLHLFGFNIVCVFSQDINLGFEEITRKDGLNNRYIDFIKKDSRGNIWFSSLNGVFRYDGLEMINYNVETSKSNGCNGILDNDIQSNFFEDNKGDIWFTSKSGINHYSRETDSFQAIHLTKEDGVKIEDGYCLFHIETDSILWLKADENIYRYNTRSKQQDKITTTIGYRFTVDTLVSGKVKTIYSCPWIIHPGIEVIHLTDTYKANSSLLLSNGISPTFKKPVTISKAIIENDTLIWLFSNEGLIAFNPLKPDNNSLFRLPDGKDSHIKDGAKIDSDYLLVNSKNYGLWLFDIKKREFTENYTEEGPHQLAEDDLREIHLDDKDLIWLSFQNKVEVNHSWLYRNKFRNPFLSLDGTLPIINSIVEDDKNQMWVSTNRKGIYVFNSQGDLHQHYSYSKKLKPIQQLSYSKEKEIWGLNDKTIYQFKNETWEEIHTNPTGNQFVLIHLSADHKVISSGEALLNLRLGKKITQDTFRKEFQVFYAFKSIYDNACYLANRGSELAIFKYFDNELILDTLLDVKAEVYHIYQESNGKTLLLGTSVGIQQLHLRTYQFTKPFKSYPQLNNTQVYFITKDNFGNYWATSDSGILCLEAVENKIQQYRAEDGFSSQDFSLNANIKARDGKIWLGTNRGLIVFQPDSIRPYPHGPSIQIKSIKVNGSPLKSAVANSEVKKLDLKYYENHLEFEIVGVNNYLAKYNTLHCTLRGEEEENRLLRNGEPLEFTKIPSGEYTLNIVAVNANGVSGPEFNLEISIAIPFQKTIWFFILMGLVILGLFYGTNRLIVSTRLKKQQKVFDVQKALEKQRRQFAADMHDDLGGGLTSIRLLIGQMQEIEPSSSESSNNLIRIDARTNELIANMREIMWAMNTSSDSLAELIAYLRNHVVNYLDEQHIKCKAPLPSGVPQKTIPGSIRRNTFLCVKEAIHNIVKHADATEVQFDLSIKKELKIVIKDNGRGFNPFIQPRKGHGLQSMKRRVHKIKGTMKVKSNIGKGTKITFEIPINTHK